MAELVVRSEGEERLFRLEEDSVVIGRQPGVAIQIDDIHSSRRHCQVIRVRGGFEVVDLKSRNGILVNGKKMERKLLRPGDVIQIGEVRIEYRDADAPAEDEGGIVLEDVGAEPAAAAPSEGVCMLRFVGGDRDGDTITLDADRTTIGRRGANTISIKDAMLSSYHCEIGRESGGYILRDLGSTNGSYVGNEPISEVALNHGARIRLGATRFLFLDPSMAALDAALDEGDDAGEWGMMREIDATATVKRRGRYGAPVGLVLMAAVIVVGYFLMSGAEKSRDATVPSPEGNKLPYYSFEDEAAPLDAPEGASVASVSGGRSGRRSLRVERGERAGAVEVAFPGIDVLTTKRVKLDGWVRTGEGAAATLRIAWTLRGGFRTPWESTAPPVIGRGGFRQTSLEVSPPEDAVDLVVKLVLLKGVSATFDDVTVAFADGRTAPLKVRSGDFEILSDDCGCLGVLRDGEWVLLNGGVVVRLADGRVLDSRHGLAKMDGARKDGASIAWSGALADLDGGDPVPFEARVTPGDEEATVVVKAAAVCAGIAFTTDRSLLEEPVYVLGPGTRGARFGVFERTESLERITFGVGWKRLGATVGEAANLAAVLEMGGGQVRLALDAPSTAEGGASFRLLTSFDAAAREARELFNRASRLARQGSLGEAWGLCEELVVGYSFREDDATRAAALMKTIEDTTREQEERIQRDYEAGREFLDDGSLARAEAGADAIFRGWSNHDRGEAAAELRTAIQELRAKWRSEAAAELAAGELRRAKDFETAQKKHLAIAVYRSVIQRFPTATEQVEEARQRLRALGG